MLLCDGAEVFEHVVGVGVAAAPHVLDPVGEGGEVGHVRRPGLVQRGAGQPPFVFPGAHGAQLTVEGDRYRLVGVEPAGEGQELLAVGEAVLPAEGYVGGHPTPAGRL